MKLLALFIFILSFSFMAVSAPPPVEEDDWGNDDWGDEEVSSPWQVSGFSEAAYGQFLQNNVVDKTQALNEVRTRLEINYQHELFQLTSKTDVLYDGVLSRFIWDTRELNISASILPSVDVKIGRQVLTWGTGDYLFLNDLFAKDWQSFFAGRDDEYLKAPSNSARASWYVNDIVVDFAWTPEFTPDNYLNGERFSFYSPQARGLIAPAANFIVDQTKGDQFSLRIATTKNGIEYAAYGYQGYWTTPVGVQNSGTIAQSRVGLPYFPKLNAWGASIRMPLAAGLFNSEFSLYQSKEDRNGTKANIANDQFKLLLGYEQEIAKSLTLGVQYYLEKTLDYQAYVSNSGQSSNELVAENRHMFTVRLRYSTMQDKLIWSLFGFYSPTDDDAYIKPSITYRLNDSWSYVLGANVFTGKSNNTFFGQLKDNTNAWARVRFQF
jgi:hypothetical protein